MIWFVTIHVRLYVIYASIGIANICYGTRESRSLMWLFNDRYVGLGGIPKVTDVLPSLRYLQDGDELLLFDISLVDIFQGSSLCANVQPSHNRHQWKLIYVGELLSEDNRVDEVGHAVYLPK